MSRYLIVLPAVFLVASAIGCENSKLQKEMMGDSTWESSAGAEDVTVNERKPKTDDEWEKKNAPMKGEEPESSVVPYDRVKRGVIERDELVPVLDRGLGRGMGFRDSSQDLLGFVHLIPDRARERILDLAATQLESGGAYHQYQPLTKKGNDAVGSNFNDDPLWLVLSTGAYLKETADWTILDELVPNWWEEVPVQRWVTRRGTVLVLASRQPVALSRSAE